MHVVSVEHYRHSQEILDTLRSHGFTRLLLSCHSTQRDSRLIARLTMQKMSLRMSTNTY